MMNRTLTLCRSSYFPAPTFSFPTTTLFPPASVPNQRPMTTVEAQALSLRKRQLSLSYLAVLILDGFISNSSMAISMADSALRLELERYTDSEQGFTLLKPSSWIKVEKAGATALFEETNKKSNNVGVVVTPVRLSNLHDFGTPEFVADKLIQAEKRKESTKEVEVIRVGERLGQNDLEVYEFEYELDSTRGGMKRVFSAAFVDSKKLYLLNITHSDNPNDLLDETTRTVLEQVLRSFDRATLPL